MECTKGYSPGMCALSTVACVITLQRTRDDVPEFSPTVDGRKPPLALGRKAQSQPHLHGAAAAIRTKRDITH